MLPGRSKYLKLRFEVDSIPISHPRFSITSSERNHPEIIETLQHREFDNFFVCLPHLLAGRIPINVHGGANVSVPHEFLLHTNRSADRIQPGAMGVPECV